MEGKVFDANLAASPTPKSATSGTTFQPPPLISGVVIKSTNGQLP
jgi:hypothetical protein